MLRKIIASPFFIFPIITCIVFWSLSLHIFTLKNDALTYYYPVRTLISDALHNHELPLWTPYINMGYPLHGDMQSGAWNPIIWIFSFLTNYSLAGFHYELLFYFCFAGIGFYYLCREYSWSKTTAFTIAIAYELSGFMIDSTQFFVCISAACYIPYIFLFFKRLLAKQQTKDVLATSFFLYLLFSGGYPSLFIITGYLLLAYLIFFFFINKNKKQFTKKISPFLILMVIVFVLLSLPTIISYVQHLPYIERGKAQSLDFVLENSMPPASMLSLISPFSTTANEYWLNTDPLMRNTYIGLVPLLFIVYGISKKAIRKNNEVKFFFITALIMFGFAWGSHFFLRQLAYYALPLMNTFRHPALFRLFGIFCLLLVAGFSMDKWQSQKNAGRYFTFNKTVAIILIIAFTTSICILLVPIREAFTGFYSGLNLTEIKRFLTSCNFSERFLLQLPFIILMLSAFYFITRKKINQGFIVLLCVADLFVATQFNMPITIIGAKRFSEVENIIDRNPERFPLPNANSVEQNSFNSIDSTNLTGSKIPFEKIIGRNDYYITPGNLSSQEKFYNSPIMERVFKNPALYFADTVLENNDSIHIDSLHSNSFALIDSGFFNKRSANSYNSSSTCKIISLSGNEMKSEVNISGTHGSYLIYLQNKYPGWKAFIDDKESVIYPVNTTFMAVFVPPGQHLVTFRYDPTVIKYAWYISVISLMITLLLLLFVFPRRRNTLSNNGN